MKKQQRLQGYLSKIYDFGQEWCVKAEKANQQGEKQTRCWCSTVNTVKICAPLCGWKTKHVNVDDDPQKNMQIYYVDSNAIKNLDKVYKNFSSKKKTFLAFNCFN